MTDVDYSELTKFDKQLLKIAQSQYPKLCRTQVRQATNKGVKIVKRKFKEKLKHKGRSKYQSTFKASKKAWQEGDTWACRIYNKSPLSHIIEDTHKHIGHKPKKVFNGKTVAGFHTFERSAKDVEQEFYKHIQEKTIPKIRGLINK